MTMPRSYFEYPHRRPGMDHDRYGYDNLFSHKPVQWPSGARVALVVVPVLEWYPLNMYEDPAAVKIPGGMDRPYPDYWNYTMRDYGTRVSDSGADGFITKAELSGEAIRSLLR